jgi:hypothetical protein
MSATPSRNDGITMPCPVCGELFRPQGRASYCSGKCRQAAHRRRHQPCLEPPSLPARRPRRPVTVYACPSCEVRYLGEQRCPDCNLFCSAIGIGGCCPACEEPVAYRELTTQ